MMIIFIMLSCVVSVLHGVDGSAIIPGGAAYTSPLSFWIGQTCYDASTDTIYLASYDKNLILAVMNISTMPLIPVATWSWMVVAGRQVNDNPFDEEMPPLLANVPGPIGVVGWSVAATVMTWNTLRKVSTVSTHADTNDDASRRRWSGLFITNYDSSTIGFVNFLRGANVTLVAGPRGSGTNRVIGTADGAGTDARLNAPYYAAMIIAPADHVVAWWDPVHDEGRPITTSVPSQSRTFISALLWVEELNWCVRIGIPIGLSADPTEDPSRPQLQHMVLNISAFIGTCGVQGTDTGPAMGNNGAGVFLDPISIAATTLSRTDLIPSVVFVGEYTLTRLLSIAPLWPAEARYLVIICAPSTVAIEHLIVYVNSISTPSPLPDVFSVDVLAGNAGNKFKRYSFSLRRYTNRTVGLEGGVAPLETDFAWLSVGRGQSLVFIPRGVNGTMVVFSGTLVSYVSYYCCLGPEFYAMPQDVPRISISHSPILSVSQTKTSTTSLSPSITSTGVTMTLSRLAINRTRTIDRRRRNVTVVVKARNASVTMQRRKVNQTTATINHTQPKAPGGAPRGTGNASTDAAARLVAGSPATSGTLAIGGVVASALVVGSSSKAVVSARLSAAWKCVATGPAEATADDSQQYLGFGAAIGSGPMGIVRGALIITSGVRLIAFGSGLLVLRQFPGTVGTVSVLVAVSVGYFLPNIVGLATQVFTAEADGATIGCAVGSLLGEAAMIGAVVMAVAGRGGSVLIGAAREFITPFRRRGRWLYRVAGLEDVLAAALVALVSNVPRSSEQACRAVSWALMAVCALHLLYVVALRPYRMIIDLIVSVLLAGVNAGFALLCCLAPRDDTGARMVSVGLILVTTAYYLSIALGLAAAAKLCRNPHAFTDPTKPGK